MKKLVRLGALFALYMSVGWTAFGAVTYVQNCSASGGSPDTCTLTGVAVGDVLYISAQNYNTATATLTNNGTPITAVSGWPKTWNAGGGTTYLWAIPNASAGSHVLNVTWASGSFHVMAAVELAGASTSAPTDSASNFTEFEPTGGARACTSLTTAANNEFLLSFEYQGPGNTNVFPSAGTSPQAMTKVTTSAGPVFEYGTAVTAGTNHVEWVMNDFHMEVTCDTIAVLDAGSSPLAQPTFSPTPGPYLTTQSVVITPPAGATACYRTDGVNPTAPSPGTCGAGSTTYTGALTVSATTNIRALSTQVGQLNSPVANVDYRIGVQTWYIRTDGGTAAQCTGLVNAAYTSGSAQPCALNHPFWLKKSGQSSATWRDDYYGGDIVKFEDAGPYYIGENNNGVGTDWAGLGFNECTHSVGNYSANCTFPLKPPDGSSVAHTKWLGYCVQLGTGCHQADGSNLKNPTKLSAAAGPFYMFGLQGANWVDMQGIDITQPDSCTARPGRGTHVCTATMNFADHGIQFEYTTAQGPSNTTVTDIGVHGMATSGILGSHLNQTGGDTDTFSYLFIRGNGLAGFDSDGRGCATSCESVGTVNVLNSRFEYNGCVPVNTSSAPNATTGTDQDGYTACTAQTYGGNGDGFVLIAAGDVTFNILNSIARWNVQDGFDLLHLGDDQTHVQTLAINNNWSEGNLGQTYKIGGYTDVTAWDNVAIQNCKAMTIGTAFPFTLNPTGWNHDLDVSGDYCRAGGDNWTINLSNGKSVSMIHNTTVGYGDTMYDIACASTCTTTTVLVFKDNISKGYANPDTSSLSNGLFYDGVTDPFANAGSAINHNLWTTMRGATCPQDATYETNTVCSDPLLTAESNIDAMVVTLTSPSPARAAGIAAGPATDYAGFAFLSPPAIGAYEFGSTPTAATPVSTPADGYSGPATTLTYTCSTPASSIYTTTGGGTPSTLYTGGIPVTTTSTYRAQCKASGYLDSAISSTALTITPPPGPAAGLVLGGTLIWNLSQ